MSRYLGKLPYMKRWSEYRRRHSSFVPYALAVFREIRASGRTVRPRVIAMLEGTGIHPDILLKALSDAELLTVKRGRAGGIYYPPK